MNNKQPQKQPENKNVFKNKNMFLIIVVIIGVMLLLNMYNAEYDSDKVSRTEFLEWMEDPSVRIQELKLQKSMDGVIITGTRFLNSEELTKQEGKQGFFNNLKRTNQSGKAPFRTHMLETPNEMIQKWEADKKLSVEIIHDSNGWLEHIFAFLPLILIIAFFWFIMSRQGNQGGRGLFSMGKSRAKMLNPDKPKTTFKDVAGCDEAKEELQEVVEFLKNPKKYTRLGAKLPKGALLLGNPGTGKTLLARAVAGEAGVPFFSMSGSDFVEMFVGVGASRVRDLFDTGKKHAPCIIFIDEIDAVGRQRGAGVGGGHDEREQTLNQLLVEMDGFSSNEGVILIAATNRADVLDKALLRPGRFDRQINVDTPDLKGREAILKVHLSKRKVPLDADVDLRTIAKGTPGLSGADLENLINEACLLSARYNNKKVSMIDFEEAKDKIMIGAERRSRVMTEEEKRATAFHEAGHCLINHLMEHADPVHKLTIIPRGQALGISFSIPEKDFYTRDKRYFEDRIAIALAGRAAEILVFNQKNTGAYNDIQQATEIARRMVTAWGMTEELGPINYEPRESGYTEIKDFANTTVERIDSIVRGIIDEQMSRVDKLLSENRAKLDALAKALLEHEVLDRAEILKVIDDGEALESTKKSRQYAKMKKMREEKERNKDKEQAIELAIEELERARENNEIPAKPEQEETEVVEEEVEEATEEKDKPKAESRPSGQPTPNPEP